jgi:KaiC/GvpD/RAD55 family RecA-like ATPase
MTSKDASRVPTGIKGFDELVEGGLPRGMCVLLAGSPGTAKTIFGLQYLVNGVTSFGEKGLYVTVGQSIDVLKGQALGLGWDLDKLRAKGLELMPFSVRDLDTNVSEALIEKVRAGGIRRMVVDSLTTLSLNSPLYRSLHDISVVDLVKNKSIFSPPLGNDSIIQSFIYNFIDSLHQLTDCTTILISESPEKGEFLTRDGVSEFVCDGIIHISFESMGGEFSRSLLVRKMRQTRNDEDIHPLEITRAGLVVHDIK